MIKTVSAIGAGNVGTHLIHALYGQGYKIPQVMAATNSSATTLANQVEAEPVTSWEGLRTDADLYLVTTPDRVIPAIGDHWHTPTGIVVHTAGSVHLDALKSTANSTGVLYPLQTFSKARPLDLSTVPFFVEGSDRTTAGKIEELAAVMNWPAYSLASEKREHLHLAAILANNYTTYLMRMAADQLRDQGISLELLQPLLQETLSKALALGPEKAQTGPARRGDTRTRTLERHEQLLTAPQEKAVYDTMAKAIYYHFHPDQSTFKNT